MPTTDDGHQLTLSARHRDGTVRLIATCACLHWHADLTVPAPMTRDADRWLRATWHTHTTDPAPPVIPAWLVDGEDAR